MTRRWHVLTDDEAFDEIERLLLGAARRGCEPDEFMDRCRAQANADLRNKPKERLIATNAEFVMRLCVHCQLAIVTSVARELGVK